MTRKTAKTIAMPNTQPIAIEQRILLVRGHKVLLDSDLAALYQVQTKVLVQAVKRNVERFPEDFMFQLNTDEFENLRSQIGDGSGNTVERMAVANHFRSQANEGGCPQEYGGRVRTGSAAAEHLPEQAAHRLNGIICLRQTEIRVCQVRTVEL